MKRQKFGEVFEGSRPGVGVPHVTLRRMTRKEKTERNLPSDETVGIYHGQELLAVVDFVDLFDGHGNYFESD